MCKTAYYRNGIYSVVSFFTRNTKPSFLIVASGNGFCVFLYPRYATSMNQELLSRATKNVSDMVTIALAHQNTTNALVVYDTQNGLTDILTAAYRAALPNARFIDFDTTAKEEVIATFNTMQPGDLVVLIQSSNFLLNQFRIRLHLFQQKLKVIEHTHLHRNTEEQWGVYIDALAYDPAWYRTIGPALKTKLETTSVLTFHSGDTTCTITGGLEMPKLNIGDYTGMENIGGTFPIGEVFTESRDFAHVNGSIMLYAYAGGDFMVNMYEPFRVDITGGVISGWSENTPASFVAIMDMIKSYERPLVREIGFGLNPAITKERYVNDITAFERILGLHFSLGEKHSVYKKPGITTHKTKFHVDVFPVIDRIEADGDTIFRDGAYTV